MIAIVPLSFQLNGQSWCELGATTNNITLCDQIEPCDPIYQSTSEPGPFYLRIKVHAIRDGNGNGGQSIEDVKTGLGFLEKAFSPHNIFFVWECSLNEISNQSYYDATYGTGNVYGEDEDPYAMNIYLFPDHPGGMGKAFDIPSLYLFTAGNSILPPNVSYAKSHVLSHEMGHALGLYHTYEDDHGDEYVNGSNCEDAGDCICDTPAEAIFTGQSTYPTCQYTGNAVDPNQDPYDPMGSNIMQSMNDNCLKIFTEGQGRRMRNIIANSDCFQDRLAHEVIEASGTWSLSNIPSGEKNIDALLLIESGYSLTIEEDITVKFARNARIVIKPGASLYLHGTLTSNDCGLSWKGVEVWGNSTKAQSGSTPEQGYFRAYATAAIENAEVALQAWGPDAQTGTGGIVYCLGTTFSNNRIAVNIAPYVNVNSNYKATFQECSFETNNSYQFDDPFFGFIKMEGVKGVTIRGCTFVNGQTATAKPLSAVAFGFGIHALGSSFTVQEQCNNLLCSSPVRTEFEGLGYGVWVSGLLNAANLPYTVKKSDFNNCYFGIFNRLVTGGKIIYNHFNLGTLPDTEFKSDQIGIALNHTSEGFFIEENTFSVSSGDPDVTSVGISSLSLGSINKFIRRNEFSGVVIGNEAGGENAVVVGIPRGLYYDCNLNSSNLDYDFLVCDTDLDIDNVRKAQGVETGITAAPYKAAGNQFSQTTSAADGDFSNAGDVAIDYNYYSSSSNQDPVDYSNLEKILSSENTCPKTFCDPPCSTTHDDGMFGPGDIEDQLQLYDETRVLYDSTVEDRDNALIAKDTTLALQKTMEAAHYRYSMDTITFKLALYAMLDTSTYDPDTLRHRLGLMDNYGAEMMLAADYMANGEDSIAFAVLANAPSKLDLTDAQAEDLLNTDTLFTTLAGKPLESLGISDLENIEKIAYKQGEFAPGLAKNILEKYGWHFPPETCLHQSTAPESLIGNPNGSNTISHHDVLEVFPNPASDKVTFKLNKQLEKGESALLQISNATGQVIAAHQFSPLDNLLIWRTPAVPPGIYFYRLAVPNNPSQSGKIILQH